MIDAADIARQLCRDEASRAELVREAVVDAAFADAVREACASMLTSASPVARAASVRVGRALMARRLVAPAVAAFDADPDAWTGVEDPLVPNRTLAGSLLDFVVFARRRRDPAADAFLRGALAIADLRVDAWRALGPAAPDATLPYLGELLVEHPELAEAVATQFALVQLDCCEAAARVVANLPDPTKRAFGAALHKQLERVFAVRQWAECRRILYGR